MIYDIYPELESIYIFFIKIESQDYWYLGQIPCIYQPELLTLPYISNKEYDQTSINYYI
jgi:hypothetical protein